MISFQKRFLFVHIPKTAGNSIQSVLQQYSEDQIVRTRARQDGVERFGVTNPIYPLKKHSTLADYRAALNDEQFHGLYKFTCVRNPWDRLVSYYFGTGERPVKWDPDAFAGMVTNVTSAADYLRLGKEADPFKNVNRILRFENLAEDFRSVCHELNISPASLPAINRSSHGDYAKYYDDQLRVLVAQKFASEIERFGYAFVSKG
jgi:hypothetical protein